MKIKTLAAILTAAVGLFLNTPVRAAETTAQMEPLKSVYDHYLKIQNELADDSLKGVAEHSSAIAEAVKNDEMRMLPADVAIQAEKVGQAKDLKAAREAFRPLSASLIKYLADKKVPKGTYREAYCPMAKASWLQTEKGHLESIACWGPRNNR